LLFTQLSLDFAQLTLPASQLLLRAEQFLRTLHGGGVGDVVELLAALEPDEVTVDFALQPSHELNVTGGSAHGPRVA
jgi:hypothetical protein